MRIAQGKTLNPIYVIRYGFATKFSALFVKLFFVSQPTLMAAALTWKTFMREACYYPQFGL